MDNLETVVKMLVVLAFAPLWWPIAKVLWEELQESLAPEGGVYGRNEKRETSRRSPGQDPWLNVPLARHRGRASTPAPRPSGHASPGGPGPRAGSGQRGVPGRATGPRRSGATSGAPRTGAGRRRGF